MINIRCDEKATKSVRGVAKLAALVAVLLLVFSCSGKEPLQFGTLKLSGKKIDDAVPGNGVADPKDWPKACSLLEKSEVKSLLPNSKISFVGKKVEVLKAAVSTTSFRAANARWNRISLAANQTIPTWCG